VRSKIIFDYTSLSSKEPTMISYEKWRALWMDISVAYYSGLSVLVLRLYDHIALLMLIADVRIWFR
jgi:hypothetical protein